MFIFLIFLAALSIEAIGTYVSVIGLSSTFQGDPIILTLAIILDFAKIIGVSLLYKKWNVMPFLMKAYLLPAVVVLMMITSYGAAGYLSDKFTLATLPAKEAQIELVASESEKAKAEARLKQINDGLAAINADYITKRLEESKAKAPEIERLNARIIELDKSIPLLKQKIVNIEAHVGPISYVSKTFDVSNETALSYIIGLVIIVFDPLAIMLIIAGNFLIAQRDEERAKAKEEESIEHEEAETERVANLNDEVERLLSQVKDLEGREPEIVEVEVEKIVEVVPELPDNIQWTVDEEVEFACDKYNQSMTGPTEVVTLSGSIVPEMPDFAQIRIDEAERDQHLFKHSTWEEDELEYLEQQEAEQLAVKITTESDNWTEEQKEEVKAIISELEDEPSESDKITIIPDGMSYHDDWVDGNTPLVPDHSELDGVDPKRGDVRFNDGLESDGTLHYQQIP